jgi:hypothetical protein
MTGFMHSVRNVSSHAPHALIIQLALLVTVRPQPEKVLSVVVLLVKFYIVDLIKF